MVRQLNPSEDFLHGALPQCTTLPRDVKVSKISMFLAHASTDYTLSFTKSPNTCILVLSQETLSSTGFTNIRIQSDSARINASLAKTRSVALVLPTGAPLWRWFKVLPNIQFIQVLKFDRARMHPYLTPVFTGKKMAIPPLHFTALSVLTYKPVSRSIILAELPWSWRRSHSALQCNGSHVSLRLIDISYKHTLSKLATRGHPVHWLRKGIVGARCFVVAQKLDNNHSTSPSLSPLDYVFSYFFLSL